jgi:hypothetical protein
MSQLRDSTDEVAFDARNIGKLLQPESISALSHSAESARCAQSALLVPSMLADILTSRRTHDLSRFSGTGSDT